MQPKSAEFVPPVIEGREPITEPDIASVEEVNAAPATANSNGIDRTLSLANINGVSGFQSVSSQANAYQWRTGDLYGSGEYRGMSNSAEFDGFVKEYLSKTEARCPGEFAIVPDNSKESGSLRVDSYEIACISDNVSSSASLLFYNDGDQFTVIAHESEPPMMAKAMEVRDQIFNALLSGQDS